MTSEQLLDTLDALDEDKLKRFKWHLRQEAHASAADLEKADAIDTVDLMMACCGPERAVQTTLYILRKMKQNHLAEELENELKVHKAPVKMSSSAQVGASVNAPVLTGNTITGPGNIYGSNAAGNVTFTNIVPRTRNYFLQFSYQFTLDPNTVNKQLRLSKGNRVITVTDTEQPYPDHPDRFDHYLEVLCGESVCGRCYWEIEWSGEYGPYISVSYKSISRKGRGKECRFGYNDQSWSLFCTSSSYSFWHNNTVTDLPVKPISRRVGVYVDHSAGTLSFYSVSGDTMSLIHTVQTTFTQPLYPGFSVYYRSSVKLC